MKNLKFLFVILFGFQNPSSNANGLLTTPIDPFQVDTFSLGEWIVKSNAIGPITIGSSLSSISGYLKTFQLRQMPSYELGFDGEEMMDVYFFKGEMAFALMFNEENRLLSSIIVLHKDLKTSNGIGVGSTASEIIKACPDTEFLMNLMMGTEYCESKNCGFTFEFSESVCDYDNGEDMPGKPVRTSVSPVRMYLKN